jgi:hypothetical protein
VKARKTQNGAEMLKQAILMLIRVLMEHKSG